MSYVIFLFSDTVLFYVFQLLLFVLLLYSFKINKFFSSPDDVDIFVQRGDESVKRFGFTWTSLCIIVAHVIQTSSACVGYKIFFLMFDFSILFYLCFLNIWFRERISWCYNVQLFPIDFLS